MKAPIAHISPTLAAAAAGVLVWLAVFVLPGSEGHPVPLVPVIQGAAGAVAAQTGPPATEARRAPRKVSRASSRAATAAATPPRRVSHPARPKAKRSHPARRPAPSVAPAQPVVVQQAFSAPVTKPGKGLGRNKNVASRAGTGTQAPGRAKAKLHGHQHTAPGQAKKSSPTQSASPPKHQSKAHRGGKP